MPRTTPTTSSATSHRRGGDRRWRHLSQDEYASAATTSPFSPARAPELVLTHNARRFSVTTRLDKRNRQSRSIDNSVAHGWSPSARIRSGSTSPGETQQIVFVLGYHENPTTRSSILPAHRPSTRSRQACDRSTRSKAADVLRSSAGVLEQCSRHLPVDTPDIHTNRMVNIWNAYQCMATFNMSRSASFFESGVGRGLGFRDSNQDLLALCTWRRACP